MYEWSAHSSPIRSSPCDVAARTETSGERDCFTSILYPGLHLHLHPLVEAVAAFVAHQLTHAFRISLVKLAHPGTLLRTTIDVYNTSGNETCSYRATWTENMKLRSLVSILMRNFFFKLFPLSSLVYFCIILFCYFFLWIFLQSSVLDY